MARGAIRGAMSGALALIALQAVSTQGGSGRVASLFRDVNGLVTRVLDPSVPAIPDKRTGSTSSSSSTSSPAPTTPGAVGNFTTADAYNRANPAASAASRLPYNRRPI